MLVCAVETTSTRRVGLLHRRAPPPSARDRDYGRRLEGRLPHIIGTGLLLRRCVIVTGGTKGIDFGISQGMAATGHTVLVNYASDERAAQGAL